VIDCEGACSDNANNVGHGVCVMGFRVLDSRQVCSV